METTPWYNVTIGNKQIPSLKINMKLKELSSVEMQDFIKRYAEKYIRWTLPKKANFSALGCAFVNAIGEEVVNGLMERTAPEVICNELNLLFADVNLLGYGNPVVAEIISIELEHPYALHSFTVLSTEKVEG